MSGNWEASPANLESFTWQVGILKIMYNHLFHQSTLQGSLGTQPKKKLQNPSHE